MVWIFWICFGTLFYTYLGYPIVLWVLSQFTSYIIPAALSDEQLPELTHIIAAHNEEVIIKSKLANCSALDYPKSKVKHVVVTDGSNDSTPFIVRQYKGIDLMHEDVRKGKLSAVNRGMEYTKSSIVVFSDANSMLSQNAFRAMVAHFADDGVGVVGGEKVVKIARDSDAVSSGEGLYWKYESRVKYLESRVNSCIGVAGELFAVRRSLYSSPPPKALTEDFVTAMLIAQKGYRVAYEPMAIASENGSANIREEMKRKVRISAGGLQSLWMLKKLLNPFDQPLLTWQYVSHKIIRWVLAPVAVVGLFVSNFSLLIWPITFYSYFFIAQCIFFSLALFGFIFREMEIRHPLVFIPFYYLFMHLCTSLGWIYLFTGRGMGGWQKAKRK